MEIGGPGRARRIPPFPAAMSARVPPRSRPSPLASPPLASSRDAHSTLVLSCLVLFRTGPGAPHHVVSRGSDPAYHAPEGDLQCAGPQPVERIVLLLTPRAAPVDHTYTAGDSRCDRHTLWRCDGCSRGCARATYVRDGAVQIAARWGCAASTGFFAPLRGGEAQGAGRAKPRKSERRIARARRCGRSFRAAATSTSAAWPAAPAGLTAAVATACARIHARRCIGARSLRAGPVESAGRRPEGRRARAKDEDARRRSCRLCCSTRAACVVAILDDLHRAGRACTARRLVGVVCLCPPPAASPPRIQRRRVVLR
jgi:hypothetical protein